MSLATLPRLGVLLALALALALATVGGIATAQDDSQDGETTGEVLVVHAIPGLPVDVAVDGETVLVDFQPGEVAGPLTLASGPHEVAVRAAGADPADAPALEAQVDVPTGAALSLVAHLTEAGDPTLTGFIDDVSPPQEGNARLTVRHTAAAPAVDVRADGTPVVTNLVNPEEQRLEVPAGTVSADVVLAGTDSVVLGPADLELQPNQLVTAYAIGSAADETLDLLVEIREPVGGTARETERLAGPDRFATSVAVSERAFPDGAAVVYLARADDPADALTAGALTDGPVLLVPGCGALPSVVAGEIARLDPARVIALGGPAAICDPLLDEAAAA